MTKTMKAVQLLDYGSFDHIHVKDIASPKIQAHELLVKVEAVSLDFAMMLMILGQYQFKPDLPVILGNEAVGEVVQIWKPKLLGRKDYHRLLHHLGNGYNLHIC